MDNCLDANNEINFKEGKTEEVTNLLPHCKGLDVFKNKSDLKSVTKRMEIMMTKLTRIFSRKLSNPSLIKHSMDKYKIHRMHGLMIRLVIVF